MKSRNNPGTAVNTHKKPTAISIPAPLGRYQRHWIIILVGLGLAGVSVVGLARHWFRPLPISEDQLGPPAVNAIQPPTAAPAGMVWIPGGIFWMGCEYFADTKPIHKVYVDPLWMDKTEVTNDQFREFVESTHYVTLAEKVPEWAEIMKQQNQHGEAPSKEDLVAGSLVFVSAGKVSLGDPKQWWKWVPGACWRHPEGPGSDLQGRGNHPVVHVAYEDALAYCRWRSSKKGGTFRLPTEAEWEFAARGGLDRKVFTWGDEPNPAGKWLANSWQGEFPRHNSKNDGFEGTAPVGSYPANDFGLRDMAGNVWEWCADWYRPDAYKSSVRRNPKGPSSSFDPQEPRIAKRVHRGGSFLCSDDYCKRYLPGARGKGDPDSSTNHLGFRCVKSPD